MNILRALILEKEASKWILCGMVILTFRGLVDFVVFHVFFFYFVEFWGVGAGQLRDERVLWGCQINYSRGP